MSWGVHLVSYGTNGRASSCKFEVRIIEGINVPPFPPVVALPDADSVCSRDGYADEIYAGVGKGSNGGMSVNNYEVRGGKGDSVAL